MDNELHSIDLKIASAIEESPHEEGSALPSSMPSLLFNAASSNSINHTKSLSIAAGKRKGVYCNRLKTCLTEAPQITYRISQVKTDLKGFLWALLMFQIIELMVMFTVTMSNERMNLEAPVLTDSILSMFPRSKLAGNISEILLFAYQMMFVVVMLAHQRRFVLGRRSLAIQSICFFIRIISIWSNILPRSLFTMECAAKAVDSNEILTRVILLWSAAGMSIFGGHMCGNYFFSGHALMTTILYSQLSHYMPRNKLGWCIAHKINILLAITIPCLILMSHNHYTLDIIGSYIVGNWVFRIYTLIAENQELKAREWFPVFWLPIVETLEYEKEKVEWAYGGPGEIFNYIKFIYEYLTGQQSKSNPKSYLKE